jgi:hypothetical protein
VLIALVLETAFGDRRRMSLDTVVAALSLLAGGARCGHDV